VPGADRIVGSSANLVLAQGIRMSLGLAFWLVAARLFPPGELGLAAAAISATMLCVLVAPLGAGSAFVALVPRDPTGARTLARTALAIVVVSSLAVAAIALLVFGTALARLGEVASDPLFAAGFVLVCLCAALHEVNDELSVGSWRSRQVVVRAAAFGCGGLLGLGLVALAGETGRARSLYLAWALGAVAAAALAVAGVRVLRRLVWPPASGRRLPPRAILGVGLRNHAVTVVERAPVLVLPIVVAELLGAAANAYWYVAWMTALAVFTIPVQSARVLFAGVAADPEHAARVVRRSSAFTLVLGLAGAALLALVAGQLFQLLGDDYAREATTPARILLAGVVPVVFVQAYVGLSRGLGRLREALLAVGAFGAAAALAAAVTGSRFGLVGVASGWVVAQCVFGVFAALRIRAVLRPRLVASRLAAVR
jgi:O-antigen/teichoic acid export membrane protein